MNLDLASTLNFGDTDGLQHFFLDHRTVHDQTALALSQRLGRVYSTVGVFDVLAEDSWLALMRQETQAPSRQLLDWLILHSVIHQNTLLALTGETTDIDLSQVDFAQPDQFYDWMFVHQQVHDYEQAQLGLT
jgi:hypothetical protein